MNGLPRVLHTADETESLGSAVLAALESSPRMILPSRDFRNDPPDREFLAWLGVPTYAKYAKGVRSVGVYSFIDEGDDRILVTPEANGGARSGFTPITDQRVTLTDFDPVTVGGAVQHALTLATT
ncbi:hypothetical protein [Microbacterium sp.]|uniref:hypothetical protein n=1 Tax=Microbacterium sp. TaxID=51671 RepID=UPI0039E5286A